MRTALLLIAMATVALGLLPGPTASEANRLEALPLEAARVTDPRVEGTPQVSNETGSSRQEPGIQDVASWSLNRYEIVGLAVPDANITFHRDRSNCGGFGGLHTGGEGRHRIDICVGGNSQRRETLLHEIAHAWVSEHIDDSGRQSFLQLRGLDSWNDGSVLWEERGTEQAAMIIAWGLGEDCAIPEDLAGDDTSTLATGFQFLTGRQPVCETS